VTEEDSLANDSIADCFSEENSTENVVQQIQEPSDSIRRKLHHSNTMVVDSYNRMKKSYKAIFQPQRSSSSPRITESKSKIQEEVKGNLQKLSSKQASGDFKEINS